MGSDHRTRSRPGGGSTVAVRAVDSPFHTLRQTFAAVLIRLTDAEAAELAGLSVNDMLVRLTTEARSVAEVQGRPRSAVIGSS